jgi:uncharacterized membrane protein
MTLTDRPLPADTGAATPSAGPALMSTNRFEAFSDGVFAIAMTLLVVDLKMPDLAQSTASDSVAHLLAIWPQVLSFITSFSVIGVIWLNHHTLFHFLKRVDRAILILNLLLLLCVAFIPYATAVMGHYSHFQPVVAFFGLVLALTGAVYNGLWFYIVRRYITPQRLLRRDYLRVASIRIVVWPLVYVLAAALSLISTAISITLYILIPIAYLLPGTLDKGLRETRMSPPPASAE